MPESEMGYYRVKSQIENLIVDSGYAPGTRIPAEPRLAERLSATLSEVRLAIGKLVNEGKLYRKARQGTFVAAPKVPAFQSGRPVWAVLVPTLKYFYPPIIEAIENEANSIGVNVLLGCIDGSLAIERQYIDSKIEENVSGIILAPVQPKNLQPSLRSNPKMMRPAGSLDFLAELPVPVVIIDHFGMDMPNIGVDCVLKDDFAGTYQSTVHMINLGYKKIASFTGLAAGQGSMSYEFHQRKKGYEAAMRDYGLQLPELPALNVFDIYDNPAAIKKYLDAGTKAFVMPDDGSANHLLVLLNRLGVKIPDDVAVIGYDDDYICQFSNPPLSSVRVPKEEMGKKAVEMLSGRIKSGVKGNYRSIVLKPSVVVRSSCGGSSALSDEKNVDVHGMHEVGEYMLS